MGRFACGISRWQKGGNMLKYQRVKTMSLAGCRIVACDYFRPAKSAGAALGKK